jgi:hypothetical protein
MIDEYTLIPGELIEDINRTSVAIHEILSNEYCEVAFYSSIIALVTAIKQNPEADFDFDSAVLLLNSLSAEQFEKIPPKKILH